MKAAGPEVRAFADPLLKETFAAMPDVHREPHTKAVLGGGAQTVRSRLATIVQLVPGGEDFVKELPRTTLASYKSGKDSDMDADSGKFTPNPKVIGTWAWAVYPQPNNPSEIESRINAFLNSKAGKPGIKIENPKDVIQ
jgi:hypothetical protein